MGLPLNDSSASPAPHSGLLFVLASNTAEKAIMFDGIAHASKDRYGGPVHVIPLSAINLHPSPDETQENCVAISGNKLREAIPVLGMVRPGGTLHRTLKKILRSRKTGYREQNIILFSEDSIFGVPQDIYPHLKRKLAPHVNAGLADNIETHTEKASGAKYSMLIDFGPIKEAIGTYKFFDMVREAALDASYQNRAVPLVDKVSSSVVRLSDSPEAPPHKPIVASTLSYLFAPDGLDKPLRMPDGVHSPLHFRAGTPDAKQPFAATIDDHVLNDSFRRALLDKLVTWAARPLANAPQTDDAFSRAAEQAVSRPANPRIVQVTQGSVNGSSPSPKPLGKHAIESHIPVGLPHNIQTLGMEFMQPRNDRGYPAADVIVVPPWDANDSASRLQKSLLISSMAVARQIDPRYADVPIILLNQNGCHDDVIKMSAMFANHGVSGDYQRPAIYDKRAIGGNITSVDGVTHQATRYFDVLTGNDARALNKALRQLIDQRMKNYRRTSHVPDQSISGDDNTPKPLGLFTVGALMSANNENLQLSQAAGTYGRFLAEKQMGAVWGGMNKPPGETFYQNYVAAEGPWLMASSSHDIVKKETREGRLPSGCDAWHIRRDMPGRIMDIVDTGDGFVSFNGGHGTWQEDALVIMAKRMSPLIHGRKTIAFYAPELAQAGDTPWEHSVKARTLKMMIGEADTLKLCRDNDALADQGILLATNQGQLQAHTYYMERDHHAKVVVPIQKAMVFAGVRPSMRASFVATVRKIQAQGADPK